MDLSKAWNGKGRVAEFITTRDLRNRPGYVRELTQADDLVLTVNGKPIAILVGVEDEDAMSLDQDPRSVQMRRSDATGGTSAIRILLALPQCRRCRRVERSRTSPLWARGRHRRVRRLEASMCILIHIGGGSHANKHRAGRRSGPGGLSS